MFDSISVTKDESSMGCGSSFQLFVLDNGDTGVAALRTGSISMSNWEPLLCVLLRTRSSLSLSDIKDSIGRREGKHASGERKLVGLFSTVPNLGSFFVLTTNDRTIDLDSCPNDGIAGG